ncbi:MAG: LamG-like jellyroll fold domain-containing protein [Kofleriaceae bacterium]
MTAGQPARIFSLTVRNAGQHLIGLGQDGPTWVAQVRTGALGLDGHGGTPTLRNGTVTLTPTHLVVTSTLTARTFYVNGQKVSDDKGGLLDAWKDTFIVELAGDPVQRNTWLGTMHLIAMYDVALDDAQVMNNFLAGVQ